MLLNSKYNYFRYGLLLLGPTLNWLQMIFPLKQWKAACCLVFSTLVYKHDIISCVTLHHHIVLAHSLWAKPQFSGLSALMEGLTSKHLSLTEEPIAFQRKERDWSSSVGRKIKVLTWHIADKERGAQSLKWCITESYPWVLGSIKRHYVHCSPPPFVCF